MKRYAYRVLEALAAAAILLAGMRASGGEGCCAHCGCTAQCNKVCRLVCEDVKVSKDCWGCVCEDFCLPGPGKPGCKHCEEVCASCDPCDPKVPLAHARNLIWWDWTPWGGPTMYTKKKLMKKTVTKKVPGYKLVVEDLCATCAAKQQVEEAAPMPAPAGDKAK